jgi:hypothetical protein
MSDRIHELLNRNLQEVFGEGDAAHRRAAIEELYTDDCVLYVPPGVFVGHEALDKFAGDLRATHPHLCTRLEASHWFAGTHSPSAQHLVALARDSDAVLMYFLTAANRPAWSIGSGLISIRSKLLDLVEMIDTCDGL